MQAQFGSTIASTFAVTVPSVRLRLVDVRPDTIAGHGTNIEHTMNHCVHPVGEAISSDVQGRNAPVATTSPSPDIVEDTDCIIVVYNVSRTDAAAQRGGRESYFKQNRAVADEIDEWMSNTDPVSVIVVTNPVDRITHRLWSRSGWPREYILGYSLSESARAAAEIGRIYDADPSSVSCPIMGSMVNTSSPYSHELRFKESRSTSQTPNVSRFWITFEMFPMTLCASAAQRNPLDGCLDAEQLVSHTRCTTEEQTNRFAFLSLSRENTGTTTYA